MLWAQDVVQFQLRVTPEKIPAAGKAEAVLTASVEPGWHLYSMTQPPGGPVPTSIAIEENPVFKPAGPVAQPPVKKWFDPNFGIDTEYFEGDADFIIPVQVKESATPGRYALPVKVRFMVCSDTLCLPPQTKQFKAEVEVLAGPGKSAPGRPVSSELSRPGPAPAEPAPPEPQEADAGSPAQPAGATAPSTSSDDSSPESEETPAVAAGSPLPISTLAYLWFAMAMGGLALLTPCVFPMIPITVSYFTKRGATRSRALGEAALYCIGIILTFTLIGFLLTFLFGAGGINRLAASPLVNVIIASIFILFALSLFGALEIRLPSSWINAINRKSAVGGWVGILLMALTFSLTSFTCTVPFVGTVMVAALHGDFLWSLLGVTAFATVFALPFFFLAVFPSWLQSLPRSGGWMDSLKITMGFLELAAGVKFISNVDLVYQWEILTRPVFITVWLAIALVTAIYLLGKFYFPHEQPSRTVGPVRVLASIFFLAVSFYLVRGLFGFPLGELDAFLPPRDYGNTASLSWSDGGASPSREPVWLTDYQAALLKAGRENRPVFIDFTGYTCTNCRWMESNMFELAEVKKLLGELVLVRLYTDGTQAEHAENLRFEQTRFGTIALPLYAIMSPRDEIIATFPGLTRDRNEFIGFLKKGLEGI